MHYFVGDTPGALPPVVPSSLPLDYFTDATADLIAPDGTVESVPVVLTETALLVTLPALTQAGVYTVQIVALSGVEERTLNPIRIPVEDPQSPWHTLETARHEWDGAPQDDAALYDLLLSAREQVLAFAPAVVDVPVRYRAAQIMQARNTWNAYKRNPGADQYGSPDFTVQTFPLDWHVRQLLRPQTGVPVVG